MENYNLMFWHMRDDLMDTIKSLEQIQRWSTLSESEGKRLEKIQRDILYTKEMMAGIVWRRS